jgi:hypothetical protein
MKIDQIKTVGDLREVIKNLDDSFTIELTIRKKLAENELVKLLFMTHETYKSTLEFDDIGYSDRVLCLGCELVIPNEHR